jgi:TonB-dependent SusC/RagA subfamily outer membrane receptor
MKLTTILICIALCLPGLNISAQKAAKKLTISGIVLDVNDAPMPNAIVMVDGIKTNVLTNTEGFYSVRVKPVAKTIGIVSFGSGVIEQEIAGRPEINFYFNKQTIVNQQEIEPVVVSSDKEVNTGYSEVDKKNVTGSISTVEVKKTRNYSSIYEMLMTVPGIRVQGRTVIVHNSRNLDGYVEPLFIVDGVQVSSIDDISPVTVESIEVLKAASAAIYGTRGYGGVILIKRKSE